ncbi:MAG: ferrochelatase [Pseudonocardia sp.]|jgi:ferrochelatase|nr:ferrochelatase [Pseudonocardia sp.]MDT7612669.1 protoporphyrin/coproporphyrin ferrochelatase [Pseudonocardiales bacterium]
MPTLCAPPGPLSHRNRRTRRGRCSLRTPSRPRGAAVGLPHEGGHRYSERIAEAARLGAVELGVTEYDLVWRSRSGPPQVPWLEPDIIAHIAALRRVGAPAVIAAPVGLVSDHIEADLDTEAADRAAELGVGFARAATAAP